MLNLGKKSQLGNHETKAKSHLLQRQLPSNRPHQKVGAALAWFKSAFQSGPTPRPPREPGRFDIIVLPLLDAKKWIVSHPKATMTILAFMLPTVVDRMPFYDNFHKAFCRCIEDETCHLSFLLKRVRFLVLCV